jgi:hypothetical protein
VILAGDPAVPANLLGASSSALIGWKFESSLPVPFRGIRVAPFDDVRPPLVVVKVHLDLRLIFANNATA